MVKNKTETKGEVTKIFIKRKDGKEVISLIDTEDLTIIPNVFLSAWKEKNIELERYYIVFNDKGTTKQLHRLIMNAPKGMVVDHINHDTTDNRKENLRVVTHEENMRNRRAHQANSASGLLGVHYNSSKKRWVAQIAVNKKQKHIGNFVNEREAVRARKKAEIKYWGEAVAKPRS